MLFQGNTEAVGFAELVLRRRKKLYSVDMKAMYAYNVLAGDSPVAILALSWSSAAAATKALGETGTLEFFGKFEFNKTFKDDVKVFDEWKQPIFLLKLNLGSPRSRRSNIGDLAASTICALVVTVSAACRYVQFMTYVQTVHSFSQTMVSGFIPPEEPLDPDEPLDPEEDPEEGLEMLFVLD